MKIKIVMDSGKEYVICEKNYSLDDFTRSFYNELPNGARVMSNTFAYLDGEEKIVVNPTHISSIEVIEK
ncbi:hypothetical protein [Neobacillus ginsengisoli]|uniref:Phage protein n=1 Tax=Neobacillus ginsengisoli TaxID=904295 RepID=A0ABT9XXD1_9BACI|nr:hypothetical protein [Neobacillus ginsengisoli]MDQ0200053.1 hypothetical protein [Neobacillus ginsengisoli]